MKNSGRVNASSRNYFGKAKYTAPANQVSADVNDSFNIRALPKTSSPGNKGDNNIEIKNEASFASQPNIPLIQLQKVNMREEFEEALKQRKPSLTKRQVDMIMQQRHHRLTK